MIIANYGNWREPAGGDPDRPRAIKQLKDRLRRSWRVPMEYRIGKLNRLITSWMAYFRLAQRVSVLRKLDAWPAIGSSMAARLEQR